MPEPNLPEKPSEKERAAKIDGRLTFIQWMLALLLGGVVSLVIKAFI